MVKVPTVSADGVSLFSRPPSLLERNPKFFSNPPLSAPQGQVEGLRAGFVERMGDWKSLAALTAGGLAYRAGRLGLAGFSMGSSLPSQIASAAAGLSAEVATFEFAQRSLHSRGAKQLWRWSGAQGLKEGLISSFVTFSALKGMGRLTPSENFVLQHGAQAAGMVLGHHLAYRAGAALRPEGSLAEQFLHAEAFNLQWAAGMTLMHGFAPRIQAFEKGLNLLQSFSKPSRKNFSGERGDLLPATAGISGSFFSKASPLPKDSNLVKMSSLPTGETAFGLEGAFRTLIELRRRIASPDRLESGEGERIFTEILNLPSGFHLFGRCEALVALGHRRDFFDQSGLMKALQGLVERAKTVVVDLDSDEAKRYFGQFSPDTNPENGLTQEGIPSPFIDSIVGQSVDFLSMARNENPLDYETENVHDSLFLTGLIALSSAVNFKGEGNIQVLIDFIEASARSTFIVDFTLTQALSQVALESDRHRLLFMQAVEGLPDPRARVLALTDRATHPSVDTEELAGLLTLIEWQNAGTSWEIQAHSEILKHRIIHDPEILETMGRRLIRLLAFSRQGYEEVLEPLSRISTHPIFSEDSLERLADFMEEAGLPTLQGARLYQQLKWLREQSPRIRN